MVNHIDNTAYIQSRANRDLDMEMSQKARQHQADNQATRQLKDREKRLLEEYHTLKKMMKERADKEITNKRRRIKFDEQDAAALLQHSVQHSPAFLALKIDAADCAKRKAAVDSMKLETQENFVSTEKLASAVKLEAGNKVRLEEDTRVKLEADNNIKIMKHESDVSLIVDSALHKDRNREKENVELQAVIVNSAADNMQDISVQTAQKELLTGLSDRQSMMQHAFETEPKTTSVSDRQFNYPFKSWQGDPSVNILMQADATIAQASDDRVQQALRAHEPDWQQSTPLVISAQRDDQEEGKKAYHSAHDENGEDE